MNETAVERIESIRSARGSDEDIAHLLRMYDESKRVNVGLIAENKHLRGAGFQQTLEKAKAVWLRIRGHATPYGSAWEFDSFRVGVDGEELWRAMDEVLGKEDFPE